jgi:RNA-directed DNA polymerase
VNGPEDYALAWHGIDWATAEESVRRLRQRIFTAAQKGDLKQVRNLQRLMLRSHSNTLVSVKRVTQVSAGRRTAGIAGSRRAARAPGQACPARVYPEGKWKAAAARNSGYSR